MVYPSAMGMVSEASADPAPAPVPEYDLNDLDNLVLSPGHNLNSTFPNNISIGDIAYDGADQGPGSGRNVDVGAKGLFSNDGWTFREQVENREYQEAPEYDQNVDIIDLHLPAVHEDGMWTFQEHTQMSDHQEAPELERNVVLENQMLHDIDLIDPGEKCQRDAWESLGLKCDCGICTTIAFERDTGNLGFILPAPPNHVFSYQEPESNMELDEPLLLPTAEPLIERHTMLLSHVPEDRHDKAEASTRRPSRKKRRYISHHCTFELCLGSFNSKYDWKRHEESKHKQRYMCKTCSAGHNHPLGGYACGFCLASIPSLEAVKEHTLRCSDAREQTISYCRIDHLREHLRKQHEMDAEEDSFDWVYDTGFDNDWLRECGFCGIEFDDWEFRATHISTEHYKNGADIKNWRVPFRKPAEQEASESSIDGSDGTDDDNDPSGEDSNDEEDDDDDDDDESDSDGDDQLLNCPSMSGRSQPPVGFYNANSHIANNTGHGGASLYPAQSRYRNAAATFSNNAYNINRYLENDEQHERLMLGIGRRPMHVIIGGPKNPAPPRTSLANNKISIPGTIQQPVRSKSVSEDESLPDSIENKAQICLAHLPLSKATCPAATHDALTEQVIDFVLNREQPDTLGYSSLSGSLAISDNSSALILRNENRIVPYRAWTVSSGSSKSTLSSYTRSAISRRSSLASTVDSHTVVPWHIQIAVDSDAVGILAEGLDDKLWSLPCEFAFDGCDVRFPPSRYANWFAHSLSHFLGKLPSKAVCWFCDEQEGIFDAHGDLLSSWANRMHHISTHLERGLSIEYMRPDYWLIDHLWTNGLLSIEVYQHAIKYNERPPCTELVPLGYETKTMSYKRERSLQQLYDLAKESRQRKGQQRAKNQSSASSQDTGPDGLDDQGRVTELPSDPGMLGEGSKSGTKNKMLLTSLGKDEEEDQDDVLTDSPLKSHTQQHLGNKTEPWSAKTLLKAERTTGSTSIESLLPRSDLSSGSSSSLSTTSSNRHARSPSRFSDLTSISSSESSKTLQTGLPAKGKRPIDRSYRPLKPIIHSRGSSIASIYSKSSGDSYSTASSRATARDTDVYKTTSRSSTANGAYREERVEKRRVPDNASHYMTTTTSKSGKNKVHAHGARYYDPQEPRSSEARYEDYKRTKEDERLPAVGALRHEDYEVNDNTTQMTQK